MAKVCSKCGVEKEDCEFRLGRNVCKLCVVAQTKKWRHDNRARFLASHAEYQRTYRRDHPEVESRKARKYRLKSKYELTQEQYDALFAEQSGCCGLCGRLAGEETLAVDHDHDTGEVRRPLCGKCNKGLGLFDDNPELLEKAAEYVRKFRRPRLEVVHG